MAIADSYTKFMLSGTGTMIYVSYWHMYQLLSKVGNPVSVQFVSYWHMLVSYLHVYQLYISSEVDVWINDKSQLMLSMVDLSVTDKLDYVNVSCWQTDIVSSWPRKVLLGRSRVVMYSQTHIPYLREVQLVLYVFHL